MWRSEEFGDLEAGKDTADTKRMQQKRLVRLWCGGGLFLAPIVMHSMVCFLLALASLGITGSPFVHSTHY